ncbi:MAG: V-type ATP synthase subunit E [Thermoproteus sp.]|jgi:V/A-type H+-transporting ATPase subunit E|nr:V-type ATP synthase subunit E [Thermoproteus sp.]
MSLFEDLVNQHIKELEALKQRLLSEVETKIKQRSYELLSKYSEEIGNVQSQVTLERERILYEALVESRRIISNTYEDLLKEIEKDIKDYIDKNRTNERYIKFLENVLLKAKEVIGEDVLVYSSPKDRNTLTILMRKHGLRGEVVDRDMSGGLIASSRDGAIVLDMTLDTLLEANVDEIKRAMSSVL